MRQLPKTAARKLTKSNLWPTFRVKSATEMGHTDFVVLGEQPPPEVGGMKEGMIL